MKKHYAFLVFILSVCAFFFDAQFLNADCEDIIRIADEVKVYKISELPKLTYENPTIGIKIENLSDKIYAEVTNDYNDQKFIIKYGDDNHYYLDGFDPDNMSENEVVYERVVREEKDGIGNYIVRSPHIYKNVNFTVKLYSNDSSCTSTDYLKEMSGKTDIFNRFYYYEECQANKDIEVCKPFINNESMNVRDFENKVAEEIKERDMTVIQKIVRFFGNYYLYILIPFILLSIIFIIRIVLLKRGMNKYE